MQLQEHAAAILADDKEMGIVRHDPFLARLAGSNPKHSAALAAAICCNLQGSVYLSKLLDHTHLFETISARKLKPWVRNTKKLEPVKI